METIGSARVQPVRAMIAGRRERADRAERVAHDVEIGAPHVEAALAGGVQGGEAHQVDDQAGGGHREEETGLTGWGSWIRWTASTTTHAAIPKSAAPFTSAARISQRR